MAVKLYKSRKIYPTTRCWMYLRHSCCKYGLYPIAVAPLLTAAAVLSLYSSVGCEYIQVQVGFTPSNEAWNESSISLGFWYLQKPDLVHKMPLRQTFHEGCDWYSDIFESSFIENDRTWNVARIMALVSGLASTLSAFLTWLFVFSPLPAGFFWPGLLLPVVMIAFIAEGSKFLLFDIGLCRSSVWLPSGINSLPQPSISCSLGHSAIICIASGSLLLVGLLMVCLKVPVARELDPNFGVSQSSSGTSGDVIVGGVVVGGGGIVNSSVSGVGDSSSGGERSGGSNGMVNPNFVGLLDNVEEEEGDEDNSIYTQDVYTNPDQDDTPEHDEETTNTSSRGGGGGTTRTTTCGGGGFGTAPDPGEEIELGRISASRLSKMAAVEERAAAESSSSLIERLIHDLNCSYQ